MVNETPKPRDDTQPLVTGRSRKRRWPLLLMVLVLAGIAALVLARKFRRGRPYQPPPIAYEGDSTGLEQTVIVPTLDTPMPPGKNVIWCSSFQVAWNHLKDDVIKAPVKVANAEEIADRLNRAPQSEADLPEGSYYATAGFVSDGIAETIQQEMASRFPSATKPIFEGLLPDAIVAYAYLTAGVKFTIPFFDSDRPLIFQDSMGGETSVSAFGIRPEDADAYRRLREQAKVLYVRHHESREQYEKATEERGHLPPPAEFAIDPCKDSFPNQIVLARIEPKGTLAMTLADLESKAGEWARNDPFTTLTISAVVLIPNARWKLDHRFAELEGADKLMLNPGFEVYWVQGARQLIEFKLDRSGAELISEAKLVLAGARPRYFLFDRPFLIYMRKRGAEHPFFVMWVDNAELLCKWQPPPEGAPAPAD